MGSRSPLPFDKSFINCIFVLFFNQITSSSNNHVHWSWESTFNYNNTITFLLCVIPFLPPSSLLDLINLKFQKEVDSVFYRHLITIKVAYCCFIGVCLGIWNWVNLPFFSSLSYLCCSPPHYHGVFRLPLSGFIGITLVPRCMATAHISHLPLSFTYQLLEQTNPIVVWGDDGQTADFIHRN